MHSSIPVVLFFLKENQEDQSVVKKNLREYFLPVFSTNKSNILPQALNFHDIEVKVG